MQYTTEQLKLAILNHPNARVHILKDPYPRLPIKAISVSGDNIVIDFGWLDFDYNPFEPGKHPFERFEYPLDSYGDKWKFDDEAVLASPDENGIYSLRDFLNKHAFGAYITFEFYIDGERYRCIGADDFKIEYGRRCEHLLDSYVVLDYKEHCHGNEQGSDYELTVQSKEEYERKQLENGPVVYTKGQSDIIDKYYAATMDCLIGNAVIMDTGSGWDAMVCVIEMIGKLSESDKNRIRSIVLGYNYKKYVKD